MTEAFLEIAGLSFSASWLVLAVILFRFLLKDAPKYMRVLLWGLVAFRLLCPVALESELSLVPETGPVPQGFVLLGQVYGGEVPAGSDTLPNGVGAAQQPSLVDPGQQAEPPAAQPATVDIPGIMAVVWLTGMAVLGLYALVSYWGLYRRVWTAVRLRGNVYQSEFTESPFVLGFLRPRIYLPFAVEQRDLPHVMAHERAHIARRDHWWKPLGYTLLTVHWFNPVMWAAYILLCRDIELACDEKVIGKMENRQRADYSQSLLNCSVHRNMILACPVAFGEVGVKERVKHVLSYRKPGMWITLLTVFAMVVSLVCFATEKPAQAEENPTEPVVTQPQIVDEGEPNRGGAATMTTSSGVEYTLSATQVTPIGMRLAFDVHQEATFLAHGAYWIERQTGDGWEALDRNMEDPAQMAWNVYSTGYSPFGPYDWPVDWSGVYGVLEPGTYRIWTTVYQGEAPCAVEFVIGDPGESQTAQALQRCYDGVQEILDRESYHLNHSYGPDVPTSDVNNDRIDDIYLQQYEYFRSGSDYLVLEMDWLDGTTRRGGNMLRGGVEYRLENEDGSSLMPVLGWAQWPGSRSEDIQFRWTDLYILTMSQIQSAEMTEDAVTLHLRTLGTRDSLGRKVRDSVTFYFGSQGTLEKAVRTTEYAADGQSGHDAAYTYTLEVLDTDPQQIDQTIADQEVNYYRSFSWAAEGTGNANAVDRTFVNTEAVTLGTVDAVIDRARQECTVAYSNTAVYHDEAAGVWKVEFLVDNGKNSTETVYLDENGVTLMIALYGPNGM